MKDEYLAVLHPSSFRLHPWSPMTAHVRIRFLRTHDLELAQRAAIYWNARRSAAGEGVSQGGGTAVDYTMALSECAAVWPVGGKCGLGLGRCGFGSLGTGQVHGPVNYGLGLGCLGLGQLGYYSDNWSWETTESRPPLVGLRDGPYRFGVRFFDAAGNRDAAPGPEAVIVVASAPRPPRNLTAAAGPGSILLNWTHSRDVEDG
jgi:hypothetical protein